MATSKKALVFGGKTGLLGMALTEILTKGGWEVVSAGSSTEMDLTSSGVSDYLAGLIDRVEPSVIFNTIAYTQVDAAEDNEDLAIALNKTFPATLGRLLKDRPSKLIQYSTDFVFDGKKRLPYSTEDPVNPLCVYGKTKLAGEDALLSLSLPDLAIVRTAWLFGPGKKNFISTILGLAAEKKSLNVVHDQEGSPTYTVDLAYYSLKLVESGEKGLFHIVNSGKAHWAEFASEAVRLAQVGCVINGIPSSAYPQKAQRPQYSVLDTENFKKATGLTPRPWSQALSDYIFRSFPSSE